MSADLVTPDNVHCSRAAAAPLTTYQPIAAAVDCSSLSVSTVEAYVRAGVAPATVRAYRADLDHFEAWGGTIPATEEMLAAYIADHAAVLKVSTLTRRLAAISIAHAAKGLPNPAVSPLVRATMRGIRRAHGAAQHQAKRRGFSVKRLTDLPMLWSEQWRAIGLQEPIPAG